MQRKAEQTQDEAERVRREAEQNRANVSGELSSLRTEKTQNALRIQELEHGKAEAERERNGLLQTKTALEGENTRQKAEIVSLETSLKAANDRERRHEELLGNALWRDPWFGELPTLIQNGGTPGGVVLKKWRLLLTLSQLQNAARSGGDWRETLELIKNAGRQIVWIGDWKTPKETVSNLKYWKDKVEKMANASGANFYVKIPDIGEQFNSGQMALESGTGNVTSVLNWAIYKDDEIAAKAPVNC